MQMHANKQNPLELLEAGDIGVLVGFKQIRTGDTLTSLDSPITLENITFPEPVINMAVEPRFQDDVDKLNESLQKLVEEDPTLMLKVDQDTGQTILSGMGELHLDVIMDRLRREFNVESNRGKPQVAYKEALTTTINYREVYKKQTGGRGKFADMTFDIGPADDDKPGLQFVNEVKGGRLPKEYIEATRKGFENAMLNGPLAGFSVYNMKVVLKDGSHHPVDSDQLAFEIAANVGFRNAAKNIKLTLLEPVMTLEVTTPDEYVGDVSGDLNKRRGQVINVSSELTTQVMKARVPLSNMFGYVTTLRSITSGRATYNLEFSHFAQLPADLLEEVLFKIKGYVVKI
jgi:elongation factor G